MLKKVGIVGSGTIGASWALNFAWKGAEVTLYDIGEQQLQSAKAVLESNLAVLRENGVMNQGESDEIQAHIHMTTDLKMAVEEAQFIQECGPENYEMKQRILGDIEGLAPKDTVIASSTSGLLITEMAKNMTRPDRLVGGHPYNPPHLLPLVEIVKGEATDDWAVTGAYEFYKEMGKEPVVVKKEVSGFIANRIQVAVFREMIDLIEKGVCTMEDADKAMLYGPGLRWGLMGPMAVLHLGGGPGGIYDNMEKQRESYDLRLADMADWKRFPVNLAELAADGMAKEVEHRPAEQGRTVEEMSRWRDTQLIQLLRMHGKL